ncbi:MAG: ABC transporter permease [Microlunatus sp.]|nr:ABC transporter permease [Microlunatus sp.]
MSTQGSAYDAAVYQQFTPHRAGLPNLVEYFRELWRRREFAQEMSRAKIRSTNANTLFGTTWLLLDPMLQASIYFVLVTFIRGHGAHGASAASTFTHLTGALFAFRLCQGALTSGARSVTGAGKVLLNTNFPRLLIPLSAVRTGFIQFLPTIPLYLVIHLLIGGRWSFKMFAAVFFLGCILVFSMGLSALAATLTVYFRDFANFLPYFLRLWMYLSPVLWSPGQITFGPPVLRALMQGNPMYSMLGGWSDLLLKPHWPHLNMWITAAAWAMASMVVGFLFFISREREFAVRVL